MIHMKPLITQNWIMTLDFEFLLYTVNTYSKWEMTVSERNTQLCLTTEQNFSQKIIFIYKVQLHAFKSMYKSKIKHYLDSSKTLTSSPLPMSFSHMLNSLTQLSTVLSGHTIKIVCTLVSLWFSNVWTRATTWNSEELTLNEQYLYCNEYMHNAVP